MRRLIVFNQISLDGYFVDQNGDMSWAHPRQKDAEYSAFVEANAGSGGELLFGRITYELMKSYWPTPYALQNDPIVAERMNNLPKTVFSRTLKEASWNNTRLVQGDVAAKIRQLKEEPGAGLALMGSGSIVAPLAGEGLVDEYQVMVIPVVLGQGRTMFEGIKNKLSLTLTRTRSFGNGNVFLCYEPMR